ncbi:hypothetical protein [Streptomyces sp. YGL11-2]|uniref:hypothetical protein n=1 Tax=Streptomyces sp. YGL11-2 TaxID=3414028 RepID=UPI003CF36228
MPETLTPAAGPDTGRQAEQPTQPAGESTPPAPPGSSSTAADEQQLAAAEQRASEQAERAQQLQTALDAVQQALNLDGNGEGEQDPAALAATVAERDKQLDQTGAELRTARVQLAAYKAAADHGARADRLLNSRSFLDTVAALDPADATFDEQLVAAIRAAVEADPDLYRATPTVPGRGGAEFNGAPAAPTKPATLRDAIAARLGA